jgi:hypothetical protein
VNLVSLVVIVVDALAAALGHVVCASYCMCVSQMQNVLAILQRIEPGLKEIKITRKEAHGAYPELMKVIKNHSRASDYMIQFVKEPLVKSPNRCDCKACELGLFKSLRMPREVYDKLHTNLFPLPIPGERDGTPIGELRYLSLEDTMKLPFTDDHQPSKQARRVALDQQKQDSIAGGGSGNPKKKRSRKGVRGVATTPDVPPITIPSIASTTQKAPPRKNFELGHISRLRGLVQCMECQKPRGIYSLLAPANMKPSGDSTIEEQLDCR